MRWRKAGRKVSGKRNTKFPRRELILCRALRQGLEQRRPKNQTNGDEACKRVVCRDSKKLSFSPPPHFPLLCPTPFHVLCLRKGTHQSHHGWRVLFEPSLSSPSLSTHHWLLFLPPKGVSFSPSLDHHLTDLSKPPSSSPRCLATDRSVPTHNPLQSVLYTAAAEWAWKGRANDDTGVFCDPAWTLLPQGIGMGPLLGMLYHQLFKWHLVSSTKHSSDVTWSGRSCCLSKVGDPLTFYTASSLAAFLAIIKICIMPREVSQTEKDKYCMMSLICGIKTIQQTSEDNKKEADSQIQRTN